MGRLISLPDKEEVPGSNPGAPTSHLQGNLPLTPPLSPSAAIILQPKCVRLDGTERDVMGSDVTRARSRARLLTTLPPVECTSSIFSLEVLWRRRGQLPCGGGS